MPITGLRSDRVKRLRALRRTARRAKERRFLVEGVRGAEEAVSAASMSPPTAHIDELLVDEAEPSPRVTILMQHARAAGVAVTRCSTEVMGAIADTVTPQGVIAVVDYLDIPLTALLRREPMLVAVLVDVRDPGNAGTVIRAADAAGAEGVIFAGTSVDPYNPKVVRAAVGSHFHVPLACVADVPGALRQLGAGRNLLLADGTAPLTIEEARREGLLDGPTAWVFGNEARGLTPTGVDGSTRVAIPIYGRAESLNLATAAALCLYASAAVHRQSPERGQQ